MPEYLYSKIADKLEKVIKDGEYGVHQKLPSETELSFQFDTSRLTIRKSIEELEKRQLVVKDRNRGTFVLAPDSRISSGSNGLVGFSEVAKRMHLKSHTQVLSFLETSDVSNTVKDQLRLSDKEMVWKIIRLRSIDDYSMTHEEIYLKQKFAKNLNREKASGSLFEIIEKTIKIAYGSQELESVLSSEKLSHEMNIKAGSPGFLAHTTSYSADGYPILYDESFYRADKYTFHNILYRHN
ncbi:GntR family transcriptional regulator [Companilactobacillus suantsaicola]|uniref:GntR family transcriptional regulator n=1 Tax=Companilactobacillus suantsaicola TaxID=2487723 RepID=A0A4Z0JTH1_9LACO|nr:GntR family transcriptional regulator, LSA1692 subfamily [Companilactobacillus suantsaicola]TGD25397.1 GntR family transcriptional regulator [Companilactobacillus suantsaicola]